MFWENAALTHYPGSGVKMLAFYRQFAFIYTILGCAGCNSNKRVTANSTFGDQLD